MQAESKREHGISKPTIPTTPNSNTFSENVLAEKKEQENKKLEEQVQQNRVVSQSRSSQEIQPATPSLKSPTTPVDWGTYPYNSGGAAGNRVAGRLTLENRANKVKEKVKERVLGCSTSNELISLLASRKVSEPEINWIKANYLSDSEKKLLATIEGTSQGNLFSQQNEANVIEWSQIKEEIDSNMKRLGWSNKKGRQYLIKRYGKSSRLQLTDAELIEFNKYLKNKVFKLGDNS